MKSFFFQVEDIPLANVPGSAEVYFRGENSTGLVEKQIGVDRVAVWFFISGEPGMAYLLDGSLGKSISLAEFSSLTDGVSRMRAIKVPDVAGRLARLALESQIENKFVIIDDQTWEKQVSKWKQEQWNGLVEIRSKTLHGFTLFWQGEPQKSDLIFSTPQGFVNNFPQITTSDNSWDVITYSHLASAQAYQCTVLRQGAMHWSRKILSRYQELVGQKLLQIMNRELNRQIRPWRWNITLDENDMVDTHFFPYLMDAAHAYRALFMAMGAQMNFVIGNNLTQRLLNETFEQVSPDERAVLQSQRLIPAAFSE
jgi:hypothetical protein